MKTQILLVGLAEKFKISGKGIKLKQFKKEKLKI